ncbi:MAG TPA: glycosyltransferase family 2 protein [Gaiellaceae bacterium]|nr:glycosyltransferase family 2 protein [Gaiellaceae bacterium]
MNGREITLAAVIMFLNEEQHLPRLLASLEDQERIPDLLLFVDDGSDDRSAELVAVFAEEHTYARTLQRPRRSREIDRMAGAAELVGFQWAVEQLGRRYDVIAKLDGDLEFPPSFFAKIMGALEADGRIGICGGPLSVERDGIVSPESSQPWHVRGATKFYRAACLDQISPLPAHLGWDTIDELRAQLYGWKVENVTFPDRNVLHLRPTGSYDGIVRGYRRAGVAAWAYGAHPVQVMASALIRMRRRPRVVGGAAYLGAWLGSALRREPRAEKDVIELMRRQQRSRIQSKLLRGLPG